MLFRYYKIAKNAAKESYHRLIHIDNKMNELIAKQREMGAPEGTYVRSYGQHGEDVAIYHLFTDILKIEKFTYIDVGAHHPYDISNTAFMYERGCTGINIEANPILFEAFPKARIHDVNICCGVAAKEGTMDFYMIDDTSGRNGFSKEVIDEFLKKSPEHSIQKVIPIEVHTLQYLIDKYNHGIMPDYMTIDIEGLEYDVLSNYDLAGNGPKVITYEVNRGNMQAKAKMEKLMQDVGYFFWARMGSNYTWIKNEYREIVDD